MNSEKKEEPHSSQLHGFSDDDCVNTNQYNSNTSSSSCQSIESELKEKWTPKKLETEPLYRCYIRLGLKDKADRLSDCGSFLEFAKYADFVTYGNSFKLHRANFCRDRLCPMCSWRRSYKIFGQVSKIMNVIADKYEFLFLTLTVPNCISDDLNNTLNSLSKGWIKLCRYKRIKNAVKGFFKALEITYNKKSMTFHPHFHAVLAVPKSYFTSRDYIQRDEWLQMWRKVMNDDTITQVDVRRVKPKDKKSKSKIGSSDSLSAAAALSAAVAEISKYSVKSSDYLFNDEYLTDSVVSVLLSTLASRRLCSFGGCFADAHKLLNLDDSEDGDLIHLDETLRSDVALQILRYGWSCGVYKLIEIIDKANILVDFNYDDEV